MTATRWQQLEDLFFRALELPEEDRNRFLERECADTALREEVRATLTAASDERALTVEGSLLRSERLAEIADHPIAVSGQDVGPWRLVHLLGRGGMGEVWLAERRNAGFEQWGALKLMRAGWRAAALVERFERERQLLARLTHPNIAGLLDGGITADGVPFLVMQYVDGTPIDRWCEESSLSNRERLRLFRTLCDVVQYA
ncbi:MAG: protein kinase, partial [Gemmatimonadetes bacterium]|nr:protein kinase [Gemmatimonadota bacterium]